MKRLLKCISAALLMLFGFALLTARVQAQAGKTFVYTNNDRSTPTNSNSVSGFSVLPVPYGMLAPVPGSPKATAGTGSPGAFASHRVTATVRRNILFASNAGSNNISAFSIDTSTGALTSVPLSPFASGGTGGPGGIS